MILSFISNLLKCFTLMVADLTLDENSVSFLLSDYLHGSFPSPPKAEMPLTRAHEFA